MNAYGDTCPLCCGDLGDAEQHLRTGATVCPFCGCQAQASASTQSMAGRPDAVAFSVNAMSMSDFAIEQAPPGRISPSFDSQIQTGASITLPN